MTRNWSWQVGLSAGITISGLLWADCGVTQLRPIADETLGEERSIVTSFEENGIPGDQITGGARRGANLFHSFQEFSIDQGRVAYFANPDGVENILGRVTGRGESEILGQLGVLGEANLFLLNPNGIVFGPNSSLYIGGSFLASTADAIEFGEQGWFSATRPDIPSPLLTINPSAFFFNQMSTGDIIVRSTTPIDPNLGTVGLSIGTGDNLVLLGGDITVEGGGLNAPGGRIDLGAVESTGTIKLKADGRFIFPAEVQRGEIVFTEAARVDVRTSERGGEIAITAQRISLTEGSRLRAGILPGQGSLESQAGDIGLDATEQISITESSAISNAVFPNSVGNAGNIEITTSLLKVLDGSGLQASTFGQGDAGSILITADRVIFRGDSTDGQFASGAFSRVQEGIRGAGGDIEITTAILEVLDGAVLSASTFGQGDAGGVIITASDRVTFRGTSSNEQFVSGIFSTVRENGVGNGDNIEIITPILEVLDGAGLATSTLGQGDSGSVIITASDRVLLDGVGSNGFSSGLFADTFSNAAGSGGKVIVTTSHLLIANGAVIKAGTTTAQPGGDIVIDADEVTAVGGGASDHHHIRSWAGRKHQD